MIPVPSFQHRVLGFRSRKGQSSFELLVSFGVVLAFTIPVLFLLLSFTSVGYEDSAKAQADATARTIADTMNSVYAQGPGAQRHVLINTPVSTEQVYAANGEVVVQIQTSNGYFDAVAPTIADISTTYYNVTASGKRTGLFMVVVSANQTANGLEVQLHAAD
jgi:uncharacterized protein (UPF0333 family)